MSPPIYAIGEKKPEKKFRASTAFESVTSANTGAMLYQLLRSHTLSLGARSFFVGSIFPMKEMDERINESDTTVLAIKIQAFTNPRHHQGIITV